MSVVSAYYYLRVVVAMYMSEPEGEDAWGPVSPASAFRAGVSAALTLLLACGPRRSSPWLASPPAACCRSRACHPEFRPAERRSP